MLERKRRIKGMNLQINMSSTGNGKGSRRGGIPDIIIMRKLVNNT